MEVYFSLGTNLGNKVENLSRAIEFMSDRFEQVPVAVSTFIETEPWGFKSKDWFLNCAVRYDINIEPVEILRSCKEIEWGMGRKIDSPEYRADGTRIYSSRIIDIDILLYGTEIIDLPELKIPHPLMWQREFVIKPLSEVISPAIREKLQSYGIQKGDGKTENHNTA